MILWSIIPRRQPFTAAGPELRPAEHPRLFERFNNLARSIGQHRRLSGAHTSAAILLIVRSWTSPFLAGSLYSSSFANRFRSSTATRFRCPDRLLGRAGPLIFH